MRLIIKTITTEIIESLEYAKIKDKKIINRYNKLIDFWNLVFEKYRLNRKKEENKIKLAENSKGSEKKAANLPCEGFLSKVQLNPKFPTGILS